jgi:hypothetical protein
MNIEIGDAALAARIQRQDRWLLEDREDSTAKIRRGIDQLDRGEGSPEDRLDAHLAKLKATPE